jgi:hypothetical protein
MTDNNKPEWFEIAEKDQPTTPRKASKTLPLAAVFATALILGIGAIISQIQDEPPASANQTNTEQTVSAENSASPTTAVQDSQSSPVTRIANPATSSAISGTSGLQNPAISQLPTKSGDDDDEGDDDDKGDDDDEGDDD